MTLYCADCDCIKLMTEFYRNSARKNNCSTYCKVCMKKRTNKYVQQHKSERQEYYRQWREQNPEKARNSYLNYKKTHKYKICAINMKHRAAKLNRTPPWLSKEHLQQIQIFYKDAKEKTELTGIRHEVDHIIPLQGKNVSGLHVPWNLQVITKKDNIKKSNKVVSNR